MPQTIRLVGETTVSISVCLSWSCAGVWCVFLFLFSSLLCPVRWSANKQSTGRKTRKKTLFARSSLLYTFIPSHSHPYPPYSYLPAMYRLPHSSMMLASMTRGSFPRTAIRLQHTATAAATQTNTTAAASGVSKSTSATASKSVSSASTSSSSSSSSPSVGARLRPAVTSAQLRAQRPRATQKTQNPDSALNTDKCGPEQVEPEMVSIINDKTGERLGPRGLEPTRYGDWEAKGRCWDF